jgi:tRNA A-37 threonylcarbamoyl transferase component Bud32
LFCSHIGEEVLSSRECLHQEKFANGGVSHRISWHIFPRLAKERPENEAELLKFIRRVTSIPVPNVLSDFEDDGAYYIITEYVEGVAMSELCEEQKGAVCGELEGYLAAL